MQIFQYDVGKMKIETLSMQSFLYISSMQNKQNL